MALTPDAVQVASEEGERLLSAARDRGGWHGQRAWERQEQAPTRLYDQRGNGIREASRLDAVSTTPTTRCGWFQRWR